MNDMPDRPLDPPDTGWINECARCGKEFESYDLCVPWCEDCTPLSITDGILNTVIDIAETMNDWRAEPTMECPDCGELTYEHVATTYSKRGKTLEYECASCPSFGFFDEHPKRDGGGPKDDCEQSTSVLPQGDSQVVAAVTPKEDNEEMADASSDSR